MVRTANKWSIPRALGSGAQFPHSVHHDSELAGAGSGTSLQASNPEASEPDSSLRAGTWLEWRALAKHNVPTCPLAPPGGGAKV